MKITKVKFYEVGKVSISTLARCSVVLDDSLILHDIRVMYGKKGKYILMPEMRSIRIDGRVGDSHDLYHPLSKDFFNYMFKVIMEGYTVFEDTGERLYIPKY